MCNLIITKLELWRKKKVLCSAGQVFLPGSWKQDSDLVGSSSSPLLHGQFMGS